MRGGINVVCGVGGGGVGAGLGEGHPTLWVKVKVKERDRIEGGAPLWAGLRGGIASTSSATSPKLVEPGEAGANEEELADNRKRRPRPWPNCQTCRIG